MASPQKENGYTPVAHELLRAIVQARLTPAERGCWDCITAHTYGWGKLEAPMSRQVFVNWTGYGLGTVNRALAGLKARNMVGSRRGLPVVWWVQKDYERWTSDVSNKVDRTSVHDGGQHISNKQEASETECSNEHSAALTLRLATQNAEANEIVRLVMQHGLDGKRPLDWPKQRKPAVRLVEKGADRKAAERACRGMRLVFPFSKGQTFDVFDLERHWDKAVAAYEKQYRRDVDDRLDREERAKGAAVSGGEVRGPPPRPLEGKKRELFRRDAQRKGMQKLGDVLG